MSNLLPQSEKRKLQREYRMRLLVIVLWAFMMLELFTFASFIPSYISLNRSTAELSHTLEMKKGQTPVASVDSQNKLNLIKQEIALLKPSQGEVVPSVVINAFLAAKPSGISFSSFTFAQAQKTSSIQATGNANTREDLLALQRALENNPSFSSVKYDQNFITKKTNIDFTVTVNIK